MKKGNILLILSFGFFAIQAMAITPLKVGAIGKIGPVANKPKYPVCQIKGPPASYIIEYVRGPCNPNDRKFGTLVDLNCHGVWPSDSANNGGLGSSDPNSGCEKAKN